MSSRRRTPSCAAATIVDVEPVGGWITKRRQAVERPNVPEPRVLLLDLETLPLVVFSWGLKVDGYLPHDSVVKDKHIACAAWKWLGGTKVYSASARIGKPDPDRRVLQKMHEAWHEADAVVAHHGDAFDIPWLQARWIALGFPPVKPLIQIDTRKIAKARFYFTSNRLDYLGQHFGLGKKIKTDFDLWKRVFTGEKAAMTEMLTYNKQDVLLLEKVYLHMRPHFPAKLNRALFVDDEDTASRTCPACGADKLIAEGYSYTRQGKRRNYVCGTRPDGRRPNGKHTKGGVEGCGAWCYRLVASAERPKGTMPR